MFFIDSDELLAVPRGPPPARVPIIVDDIVYVNVAKLRGDGHDYENPDIAPSGPPLQCVTYISRRAVEDEHDYEKVDAREIERRQRMKQLEQQSQQREHEFPPYGHFILFRAVTCGRVVADWENADLLIWLKLNELKEFHSSFYSNGFTGKHLFKINLPDFAVR